MVQHGYGLPREMHSIVRLVLQRMHSDHYFSVLGLNLMEVVEVDEVDAGGCVRLCANWG